MHSFPPHIMNGFIVYPGAVSQILITRFEDDQFGRAVTGFFYIKFFSEINFRMNIAIPDIPGE